MEVVIDQKGEETVIKIKGRLDTNTAPLKFLIFSEMIPKAAGNLRIQPHSKNLHGKYLQFLMRAV